MIYIIQFKSQLANWDCLKTLAITIDTDTALYVRSWCPKDSIDMRKGDSFEIKSGIELPDPVF